jgi:hypothetical protein
LEPRLPTALADKTEEERAALVGTFDANRGLVTAPLEGEPEDDTAAERKRIVNTFVQGFRRSPLGERMDQSQLNYFIGSQIDELLDGDRLRVEPIVEALRQQSVTDPEIFLALHLAGERLTKLGVELVLPNLDVQPELRADLIRRAKAADTPRSRASIARASSKLDEDRRKRFEEFELASKKAAPPGRAKLIRIAVMITIIVGVSTYGFFTRPNRDLMTAPFADTVPLRSAELVDGAFSGTIDWERWSAIPAAEQRERVEAFEAELKRRGFFTDFQLRGPDDQVLAVPVSQDLKTSPRLFSDYSPSAPPAPSPEAEVPPELPTEADGDGASETDATTTAGTSD